MPDQRKVGHAIRRRMGAASSHLEQAWQGYPPRDQEALSQAEATARGNVAIPAGATPFMSAGHIKGVPDAYETGSDTVGRVGPPLAKDNAAFVAGVSAGVVDREPTRPKPRLSPGESAGARLTVSPSMKVPTESPVPTQGGGRVVPSTPSRQGSFSQGQQGSYAG